MAPPTKCVAVALVLAAAVLHLTDATSPPFTGFGLKDGPCFDAVAPASWPAKEESQVCGSDGLLYPSKSAIECGNMHGGNVTVQERKECGADAKSFDPCLLLSFVTTRQVCGSDNVTYTNVWNLACTANMHNVEISVQSEGECDIECPYSPIYKPVCSSNELTFANEEAFKCRQILQPYSKMRLQQLGACKRTVVSNPCYQSNVYRPACASNGRTYANAQHVRCLKAANPALEVLHDGECTLREVELIVGLDDVCRMAMHRYEWNPICGSDNVTYINAYTFLCTAKKTAEDKKLEMAYKGECEAFNYCRQPVPVDAQPVCGSDGNTYPHENALYCAQSSFYYLNKKHGGPCDKERDDPCLFRNEPFSGTAFLDNSGNPVCGSNNVTYVTPQALWCAAKTKPDIKFIHAGECF